MNRGLDALSEGDVLIVTRLDRLARSTRDLLDIVHTIETRGAKLKALTDSWTDTITPTDKADCRLVYLLERGRCSTNSP
ncbi:recombinase family protein [Sulfitobacter delicatus]|uniref:recombinase family protein n=1 Tax=Sulfitobacter delicatus TaxID=218672 RepID=UPI001ABEEE59